MAVVCFIYNVDVSPADEAEEDSPEAGHHAAHEEHAVALDEGGQEGEEAVDGQGDEQALLASRPVRQAAPEEGAEHHPQIHDAPWEHRGGGGGVNHVSTQRT